LLNYNKLSVAITPKTTEATLFRTEFTQMLAYCDLNLLYHCLCHSSTIVLSGLSQWSIK